MKNYYVVEPSEPRYGEQVLIILAENYNDLEFFYPYYRLNGAGYQATVAGIQKGDCKGKNQYTFPIELEISQLKADDYDMLYVPGGKAPEILRKDKAVLQLVKNFVEQKKPVVSICHGPLVLADAGVIQGKKITCWPECKDDIVKAGGQYIDTSVVRDDHLITSRWPGDLPNFMREVLKILKE